MVIEDLRTPIYHLKFNLFVPGKYKIVEMTHFKYNVNTLKPYYSFRIRNTVFFQMNVETPIADVIFILYASLS